MRDTFKLQELTMARNIAAKKVLTWMDDEAKKGNLRQNRQAPAWREYERAQAALDKFLGPITNA